MKTVAVAAVISMFVLGCTGPRWTHDRDRTAFEYRDGTVSGKKFGDTVRFTSITATFDAEGEFGKSIIIELEGGDQLRVANMHPAMLLESGRVYRITDTGARVLQPDLKVFEPQAAYSVSMFEGTKSAIWFFVKGGVIDVVSIGADGGPPSEAVLVASDGTRIQLPCTEAEVVQLWGPPVRSYKFVRGGR